MVSGTSALTALSHLNCSKVLSIPRSALLCWLQMYNEPRARFFAFNYGPEYDLTLVRNPVILFSGGCACTVPGLHMRDSAS
jgi:hypothetical protein